jgi:hypothetical protein
MMEGMRRYGWGVVDRNGEQVRGVLKESASDAEEFRMALERSIYKHYAPFRTVELFYKDA